MSLALACAEVQAVIGRAQSLVAETPASPTAAEASAVHLSTAASTLTGAARVTTDLSGELVLAPTTQVATVTMTYPPSVTTSGGTWMVAAIDAMPRTGGEPPGR